MKSYSEADGIVSVRVLIALTALAALMALMSCAVEFREPVHDVDGRVYSEDLYAYEAPPAPQAEVVVGVAPSPEHIWVGGYWTRYHDSWHWVRGRWAPRPHAGAVWIDGHWDKHPRGYVYVQGRWRRN